jgi:hypothetical protein
MANEFAKGNSYINGIESFWDYAKNRLVKFKDMNKSVFDLLYKRARIFRKEPLKLS